MRCFGAVLCLLAATTAGASDTALLPGEIVEAFNPGAFLVRCFGEGADRDAAIRQALLGCLHWYASDHLARTPQAKTFLAEKWDALALEVDRFLQPPGPGGIGGTGLRSQRTLDDNRVRVDLTTRLDSRVLRRRLVELGVLSAERGGAGRTVALVPSEGAMASGRLFLVWGVLIPRLTEAGFEVRDSNPVLGKRLRTLEREAAAKGKPRPEVLQSLGCDLVLLVDVEMRKEGDTLASAVGLRAVAAADARIWAAASAVSPSRSAQLAGQADAAALEAANDATAQLVSALEAASEAAGPRAAP